jgi:hypothetical protein
MDAEPCAIHRFEVTARADSTREHFVTGKAVLEGTSHAPPLAEAVTAHGVITIRPIGQRIIRYELAFVGDDSKPYELVGQKDIRWLAPVRSFTWLPAEILDGEHRRVATCDTAFDLRRVWRFLRSFRPTKYRTFSTTRWPRPEKLTSTCIHSEASNSILPATLRIANTVRPNRCGG